MKFLEERILSGEQYLKKKKKKKADSAAVAENCNIKCVLLGDLSDLETNSS